jgi:hypothetical protein
MSDGNTVYEPPTLHTLSSAMITRDVPPPDRALVLTRNWLVLFGIGAIAAGAWLVHPAVALIFLGATCIGTAGALLKSETKDEG